MNRRQLIAASAAALACRSATAAASVADLGGDIDILQQALALHPGLYRYSTPGEVNRRIGALRIAFATALSEDARYLVLSRFLATLRCGHSYGNFFNQKRAVAVALFDRKTRLPFHFVWIDGRMVVTADPARLGLPPGSQVLSVNGVPASQLLASLFPYARADGHNDAKRVSLLGVTATDSIEYFDVFHGLVFGAPQGGVHQVVLRAPAGRELRLDLPAIGLAERRAQMVTRDYSGAAPVWDWTERPDGVAVLTMPGWALYDSKWDWRSWLDDRLNSLGGVHGLVVDLRQNEGGEDCGDPILARLASAPFSRPGSEQRVRFQRTPASLDRYLDTWDDSFRTLGVGASPLGGGVYRLVGERGDDRVLPRGPHLTAPTAVLVGPVNSSATFGFAEKAKLSGGAKLFGETTGGNRRGINGGCFFFVRLPASGLEFDLPLIGYFPPGHPPDAGLAPDVEVRASAADIAKGFDRTLETAARWIKTV